MISVDSLLYKIDQKLNKLSTLEHQQIQLEDKILALNEAQINLVKSKVTGFSPQSNGMGMSSFLKRYSDLQKLLVPYKGLPLRLTDKKLNQWSTDIEGLEQPFMFYMDAYVIASKGRCKDRQIWVNNDLAKYGEVSYLLTNEHTRPSFEWQETFSTLSDGKLNIFSDGFNPSKLFLSYLRYPRKIDKVGYINFSGNPSTNVDSELEEYLEDEIADIAVMRLGMYTENPSAVANSQLRIQTNE